MIERYLAGRAAMVTGGASGQGRAIALALAEHGADVAVGSYLATHGPAAAEEDTYLPPRAELDAVCHEIMARGAGAVGCDLDVRRTDSVEAFHAAALNAFGKVDILINAAGVAAEQPICGHTEALWLDIIDTNLSGYFRTTRACLPGMIERGWGRIVNIASTAASVGAKDNPAYCASKSGILGLTRCVALEGAPHGVTCNAISPGFVNTKMMRASVRRWLAAEGNKRTEEEYIAGIAASYPRKSIIEPEEIGAVAAFLCRDESSGINAQDITVSTGALW
jgi:NAD(P)-dependent dehydrogenase (short-subunit alcohol dehydrogenase family)